MPKLLTIYKTLLACYGHRDWWPAESPFEVCVGAILTQNTNWGNVEKAIFNLKQAGRLSVAGIAGLDHEELAALIRPAGYYNVKAGRLQDFVAFLLQRAEGDLDRLFASDMEQLRNELLAVRGIGPETADSILLYAGNHASFVVDTYTRRIFSRLGLVDVKIGYEELRSLFMGQLPRERSLYNEYHALIVEHAKQHCRTRPLCDGCCLVQKCRHGAVDAPC